MSYHLKTYILWTLALIIRTLRFLEYFIFLFPLRPFVNIIVKYLAQRLRISLVLEFKGQVCEKEEGEDVLVIRVKHPSTFIRAINEGPLGLAESYAEGWWECEEPDKLATKVNNLFGNVRIVHPFLWIMDWITFHSEPGQRPWEENNQSEWTSQLGKKVFLAMMGPNNSYTCGYWDLSCPKINLEQAQEANYHRIATKLELTDGMTVLELGCGSGAFAHFLSKEYKIKVVGCTHSKSETEEARSLCDPDKVTILECDYTQVKGKFDRVVCIQMLEHLGGKYDRFFKTVSSYLEDGGRFLLQVSVLTRSGPLRSDPCTRKYFLSNAVTPSQGDVIEAISKHNGFAINSIEGLGPHLMKTWEEYGKNLDIAFEKDFKEEKYKRFFILFTTAIRLVVKTGRLTMWQIVISKNSELSCFQ